ncbi:MAG: DnaD domain protein [Ruminococcus sp.]|nr:DnaD domain protein [Ruminococcus sp.]
MMTLKLKNKFQANATLVTNDFIDNYMASANGEFVKVYLFLLRHLDDTCPSITVSTIADFLNHTENDVLRAFRYWEARGLLSLEKDAKDQITGIALERYPSPAEKAPSVCKTKQEGQAPVTPVRNETKKAIPLDSFKAQKELKSLLFIAEQYLGKTLSHTDVDAITYFYNTLGMSADLIEYLIETCVENGHKSIHYIQKVALSWADEGIKTVEQARQHSMLYNKNCYTVLQAFGIKNRGPAASEIAFIQKWTEEFAFTLDIIQEACSRTISATHQPSFEYADTILTNWHAKQVQHLPDIAALDAAFQKEKSNKKTAANNRQKVSHKNLNNFERRTYDMDSLEAQLLKSN